MKTRRPLQDMLTFPRAELYVQCKYVEFLKIELSHFFLFLAQVLALLGLTVDTDTYEVGSKQYETAKISRQLRLIEELCKDNNEDYCIN
jgi:hypothetical protein